MVFGVGVVEVPVASGVRVHICFFLALLHTFCDCALFVRYSAHRAQLLSSGSDPIVVLNHQLGAPLGRVHVHSHRPSTNE
jgi:hypothetical protein